MPRSSKVRLVWATPDAEKVMGYCARVSNPANQENPDVARLLRYCVKHGHWSVFEMADLCMEITTSRAISAQILRHRSFSFQEFSQRYAESTEFEPVRFRRQDVTNRQNSIDDIHPVRQAKLATLIGNHLAASMGIYELLLKEGVAKECARMVLPLTTQTKLYMKGSVRSWIHYIDVRADESTQLEHREIAEDAKRIFVEQLPIVAAALGWE